MISSYKMSEDNVSIEYKNLYAIDGKIYFLTTENINLPYVKKFTISYDWKPEIMKFNSEEELIKYVESLENLESIELSVLSDNLWYGHVGHGLFDVLYPIYLALLKFGYIDEPFTFLSMEWQSVENMMYSVIKKFTKQGFLEYTNLTKNYHFKTLVAGTDLAGNRVINDELFLYGKKWNGVYYFKKRLFDVYNISFDKPTNIEKPNVIIINNKRFTNDDMMVINKTIETLSSICNIKFVDWYQDYKHFGNGSFMEQMKDIQDVDIQVTAPGTAMMYTPLLKKGAVNINIGYIEHTQTNGSRGNLKIIESKHKDHLVPAYLEQTICAGSYHTTSLYYNRYKYNNLEFEPLVELIKEAVDIIKNKQITEGNLNIDGRVFREYCKRAKDSYNVCTYLTYRSLQVEFFVNEHPYALPSTVDIELLRSIKDEFNYDRSYEICIN